MSRRGILFAVSQDTAESLLAASSDEDVLELVESLEEAWDEEYLAETDQSWDPLHRALTDGTLGRSADSGPLGWALLGGKQLHRGGDHIASLVFAKDVPEVVRALSAIDEGAFRERYFSLVPPDYSVSYGEEDADFAWANLGDVLRLYRLAAERGRAVLFSVDAPFEEGG